MYDKTAEHMKVPDTDVEGEKGTVAQKGDAGEERGSWSGKLDFIMTALSYAVGLGNIWRFPFNCYRNGGGAFLIPYIVTMALTGVPVFFLELAFGQYGSQGVVSIWRAVPLMKGIGWGMFLVSLLAGIYYNMINAWCFFYIFASFNSDVPWRSCDNEWNTPRCSLAKASATNNCTANNGTWHNGTCYFLSSIGESAYDVIKTLAQNETEETAQRSSPSDEYFHNYMLDMSSGIHDLGPVRWHLALCLLLCWIIVAVCLSKGIQSSGKVTYVTSTFPYVILFVLLIRGVTLPGSGNGILFYITPRFEKLLSAKVWGEAAVQVFFSLSCCWGGTITLASYNKFNNNVLRDAIIVAMGDFLTSIFGGFVIFAILGYMAHELNVGVDDVAKAGPGLAFIAYPEAVTKLPISPLWAILFMLMLINLGLGTQFTLVTTVQTTLIDVFSSKLRRGHRPVILLLVICAIMYLLGLTCTTRGGMYMVQLMDSYAASYSLLILGFAECVAISWLYGIDRFYKNLEEMLGRRPSVWWKICWKFITPAMILFIILFTWIDFKRSQYGDYVFPPWADVMGWMMTLTSVLAVPVTAIYLVATTNTKDSLIQRLKFLIQPSDDWGPAHELKARQEMIKRQDETRRPLSAEVHHDVEMHTISDGVKVHGDDPAV